MESIVDEYNRAEREGRATVPNRAIEAFSLELWNTIGYPFKVNDESELWRYHDSMHDGRFETNLHLIREFTANEFVLLIKTAKQILSFSERHFPIRNSGKHALTRALYQYQLIIKNRPHDGPLKVLEIGHGSGYLGMLLANDGHQYHAMDAAQAFYLYQKKLWSDVYGTEYFDYSESSSRPENAKITHIPWWRFANLSIPLPEVDIVTVNHALSEMHENAAKTIFARLYEMWGDNENRLVIAESLGWDFFRRRQLLLANIRSFGFFIEEPKADVYIWRPHMPKSNLDATIAIMKPTTLVKIKKLTFKLIASILGARVGANLAKFIRRGPRHQAAVDQITDGNTESIRRFFDDLVTGEKTADEIFLSQISQAKF